MSLASRMLVIGTILLLGACESSPVSYGEDEIKVTVTAPNLTITNESDQRIVYVIMTADYAALALIGLTGWPSINPGGSVSFEYSEIAGYDPGKAQEALIRWAPVTGSQDGPANAEAIRFLRAPL